MALIDFVATIIWSFVDIFVFKHLDGYHYGIMQLPSPILSILIWWVIGIVHSIAIWFLLSLTISPTVVRTDAVIEINEREKIK